MPAHLLRASKRKLAVTLKPTFVEKLARLAKCPAAARLCEFVRIRTMERSGARERQGNGRGEGEIDSHVAKDHWIDRTVVVRSMECALDLKKEHEAPKVGHSENHLPQVCRSVLECSQSLPKRSPSASRRRGGVYHFSPLPVKKASCDRIADQLQAPRPLDYHCRAKTGAFP
jgi:hypothetical protein